jgi:hypothetical protein
MGSEMKTSTLVRKVEARGGRFVLRGRSVSLAGEELPPRLRAEVKRQAYLLKAWVLERAASRKWDASGHDYCWWREDILEDNQIKQGAERATMGQSR